jgi:putative colanic acid biosynthesis acetyltransferase WcaF
MSPVRLRDYDNSWYNPGRSWAWQVAWFFLGLPVLRSALIPSSGLRVKLLRLFGARIGGGVVIKPSANVKYPWHLVVGNDCWIGEACWIDNLTTVQLGNNVCLSQGCYLCTGNHDWKDAAFGLLLAPIAIHDGAWVGAKAILMPGVVLGEGAVAAAGSVVSRSIPALEIHSGNPAEFRKYRAIRTHMPAQQRDPAAPGDRRPSPMRVEALS